MVLPPAAGRLSRRRCCAVARLKARLSERAGAAFVLAGITGDTATRDVLSRSGRRGIDAIDISTDLSRPGARNLPSSLHPSRQSHHHYAAVLAARLRSSRGPTP